MLLAMLRTPFCVPAAGGLKTSIMVQPFPGAMAAEQLLVCEKAPLAVTVPICSMALPLFVKVTVWVPFAPTTTLPKLTFELDTASAGDCNSIEMVFDPYDASAASMLPSLLKSPTASAVVCETAPVCRIDVKVPASLLLTAVKPASALPPINSSNVPSALMSAAAKPVRFGDRRVV